MLETARELIAEAGYGGVTMRDLARRSGVSVPTLYKLFGDKDALLVRAVGEPLAALLARAERQPGRVGVERLVALPELAARAMLRAPGYSRAVVSVFLRAGRVGRVMETVTATLTAELERALGRMAQEGSLRPWVDPAVLAERLVSHHVMVCMQWAGGQVPSRALEATLVHGLCLMAGGAARGEAARRLEARARETREAARLAARHASPAAGTALSPRS